MNESGNTVGVSRRGFLGATTALGAGLAIGGTGGYVVARSGICRQPSDRAWQHLKQLLSGRVLRPSDEGFTALVLPNNLRYSGVLPQGVARCMTADEVSKAILWARNEHIPLIARSAGHSYAGYSTTNGLMIELGLMNGVTVNADTSVTIGGGARNGDVYGGLKTNGVAITHGRCPQVGAAGFLLGGGIGFSMRMNGFAVDAMTASQLVTADGKILTLDKSQNSELLWASRGGGGGNFGVSTSFTLDTFDVGGTNTKTTVFYHLQWNSKVPQVARKMLDQFDAAPKMFGSRMSIRAPSVKDRQSGNGELTIDVLGQYQKATKDDLMAILSPIYDIAKPSLEDIQEGLSYWDAQAKLDDFQAPTFFQEKSTFVNTNLSDDALARGLAQLRKWPGTTGKADLRLFQTGLQTNVPAPDDTAFVHRSSHWLMVVGLYWNDIDRYAPGRIATNLAWQKEFYADMLSAIGKDQSGAYQNFTDPTLQKWQTSYYGANYRRLAQIKDTVDPHRVFEFPQAL